MQVWSDKSVPVSEYVRTIGCMVRDKKKKRKKKGP